MAVQGLSAFFPGGPEGLESCWSRWLQRQDAITAGA